MIYRVLLVALTVLAISPSAVHAEMRGSGPFIRWLAYARARKVRDILVGLGLPPRQLRIISAADFEPLVSQAYTDDRRSRNRRVEVVLMETLMQEYDGKKLTFEERTDLREGR